MQILSSSERVPIKGFTDGVPVEDEALKQLKNTANLPFIFKHVAVMPDVHSGKGSTIGSVVVTKGAIIPACVGVDIGCFSGQTKIPLMNGTQKTLLELSEENEPFWVYSVNNFKVVPGRAICRKTRSDAELVKVVVSGGDEIICTPDHQFMLLDGTYKEAQHLRFNESLMPLYRKWQARDGYESANCGYNTSAMVHKSVWESLNGKIPDGYVVHHKDHVHFNNSPDNLELLTNKDHSFHHRNTGKKFDNSDPMFQIERMKGIKRRVNDTEERAKMEKIGTENITKYMNEFRDDFLAKVSGNGKRGAQYLKRFNQEPRPCSECEYVGKNPADTTWHKRKTHGSNHKVISVQQLNYKEDVYCLTVDDHHNFALSAGVFVHNCGMMAVKTNLATNDMPDNLLAIRTAIEKAVPHGRTDNGGGRDKGAWGEIKHEMPEVMRSRLDILADKHPKLKRASERSPHHLGTLGTGNHFIELCLDENQDVWIMLHSGSRGIGNGIGTYFIDLAKEEMRRFFINLPDMDLAYLPQGSKHYDDYMNGVSWAQGFARLNRECMMKEVIKAIGEVLGREITTTMEAVNCHHNYVNTESHFGSNVLVTRKGAVRAREGDLGIIPGSMGAKSFIVRGKGNADSFHSCSHGAGRAMSRTKARALFTIEDHIKATEGVECRKDIEVLDETPAAYKSIDDVMAAQSDLVEIVHTLKQIVCIKG